MPVRITRDSNTNNGDDNYPNNGGGGTSGRGGGGNNFFVQIIIWLFTFVFKHPKVGIPLIIVAGLAWFFFGRGSVATNASSSFSTGCSMKQEVYDQAEVYEPLADNTSNPLPESFSLEKYCPQRLNQGQQGSCVGWSSSYAARTILQAVATNARPDDIRFSPSYLYNKIALEDCQGAYIKDAMQTLNAEGAAPFNDFAYDEYSCTNRPSNEIEQVASNYKIKGFNRLTRSGDNYKVDLLAIKQNIAQKAPVVIGMAVGGSFMQMKGNDVWLPTQMDYNKQGFGGHAMCVVGYDDYKQGGAFQIMNSWGNDYGDRGFIWVRYKDFDYFVTEAYGLYPMGSTQQQIQSLKVDISLIDNTNQQEISLYKLDNGVYSSKRKLSIGTRFKIAITNNTDCYAYVMGQETDGSNYVLFPYTKKHSPYCGIVGTRLFPKDYSLELDNKGTADYMSIIISQQPIDYNELNAKINKISNISYKQKVFNALSGLIDDVHDNSESNKISFETSLGSKKVLVAVIELKK